MLKILPIMPALCLMPVGTYYAHNYAGIIGSGLTVTDTLFLDKSCSDPLSLGDAYVTGYGKTAHFAHYFKIELLVLKGSVDLKQ